ncbi:hypothetical protein IJ847_02430 [Candidatus Saccharibacteria bacterium]|nr:hypothetical protein [Candidatus Saccharibacteria bacterium]
MRKKYLTEEESRILSEEALQESLIRAERRRDCCEADKKAAFSAYRKAERALDSAFQRASKFCPHLIEIWADFESYRGETLGKISALRRKLLETKNSDDSNHGKLGNEIGKLYSELNERYQKVLAVCDKPEMHDYRHAKSQYLVCKMDYEVACRSAQAAEENYQKALSAIKKI